MYTLPVHPTYKAKNAVVEASSRTNEVLMDSFATRLSSTEEHIMTVLENKIMEINTQLELKTGANRLICR